VRRPTFNESFQIGSAAPRRPRWVIFSQANQEGIMSKHRLGFSAWAAALSLSLMISHAAAAAPAPELLPNNQAITPTAARGSHFAPLNRGVATDPSYVVGQAVTTAVSPDGKTLLVLTSGYNLMSDATGAGIPELSTEFVFVFDIAHGAPVQKQAIPVAN